MKRDSNPNALIEIIKTVINQEVFDESDFKRCYRIDLFENEVK